MLEINWAAMGVIITVLGSLLALAYNAGSQNRQIKQNRESIENIYEELRDIKKDNKDDHKIIYAKLDRIIMERKI